MNDAAGHGSHDGETLLVGDGFFIFLNRFILCVELSQVIDLGRRFPLLEEEPRDDQDQKPENKKRARVSQRKAAEALIDGGIEIAVVDDGREDPEGFSDHSRRVCGDLPHAGEIRIGPPVGVILGEAGLT